jgi:hypothetical protein
MTQVYLDSLVRIWTSASDLQVAFLRASLQKIDAQERATPGIHSRLPAQGIYEREDWHKVGTISSEDPMMDAMVISVGKES